MSLLVETVDTTFMQRAIGNKAQKTVANLYDAVYPILIFTRGRAMHRLHLELGVLGDDRNAMWVVGGWDLARDANGEARTQRSIGRDVWRLPGETYGWQASSCVLSRERMIASFCASAFLVPSRVVPR
jgi:hypothetical protein